MIRPTFTLNLPAYMSFEEWQSLRDGVHEYGNLVRAAVLAEVRREVDALPDLMVGWHQGITRDQVLAILDRLEKE